MSAASSKLTVKDLTFTADEECLIRGINLTVATGETLVIVGPSGAGKSTFLRLLCRLEEPSQGTVYFDGTDYRKIEPTELRTRIGLVPQAPALQEGTVRENVTIGPRLRNEPVESNRIETLLGHVDLDGYADRSAAALSGGEAQRVAIARTLMIDPEVLLLDEPTASLDPDAQAEIEHLLSTLLTTSERTVLLVTHDQAQAGRIADRVVQFSDGQIQAEGHPTEVIG